MLKLNRTTEYAIIALRHLHRNASSGAASAREIADLHGLPFDITAKTLQRLKEAGFIYSAQGAHGGYRLQRPLTDVTLAEFLSQMEGGNGVVACAELPVGEESCEYRGKCQIHGVMRDLNARLKTFLSGIRLSEFAQGTETPVSLSSPFTILQQEHT